MFCIGCGYSLVGCGGRVCPECGRGFDPADKATWRDRDAPRVRRALISLAFVLASCPLWFVVGVHLEYVLAWWVLGRQPVPSLDDPVHDIGALNARIHFVVGITAIIAPWMSMASVLLAIALLVKGRRQVLAVSIFLVSVGMWPLTMLALAISPFQGIMSWWFD